MGTVPEKYFFSSENIFISVLTSSTMTMITISEHYIHCYYNSRVKKHLEEHQSNIKLYL